MASSKDAGKAADPKADEKAKAADPEDGLTDEDRALKEQLEATAARVTDGTPEQLGEALDELRKSICESTSSMTSVPKPLKFLAPHYPALKLAYRRLDAGHPLRPRFADLLSVLAMVSDAAPMAEALAKMAKLENQGKERAKKAEKEEDKDGKKKEEGPAEEGKEGEDTGKEEDTAEVSRALLAEAEAKATRECLAFKLEGSPTADIGQWGHEYVRTLAGQVARAYQAVLEEEPEEEGEDEEDEEAEADRDARLDRLTALVMIIAPYCMGHHAEAEALDLLMETQQLAALVTGGGIVMDDTTRSRACLYLLRCADYLGDEEDQKEALHVALALYLQSSQHVDAARVALRMGSPGQVRRVLQACGAGEAGAARRLQIGYVLGRHGYRSVGYGAAEDEEEDEEDDEFANAAVTAAGSALLGSTGVGPAPSAAAAASSAASAPALASSLSSSSIAAHAHAMGRAGAVGSSWLPEDSDLPAVARISDEVKDAIGNASLSAHFHRLASSLDLAKPRSPDEVFKTQTADVGARLRGRRAEGARLDSARANLASSYVSAFVNAGHGTDAVLYDTDDDAGEEAGEVFKWVNRNDASGRLAAASALGLIHLWDHEEGPIAPQPLVESADPQVVAGGALAVGVSCVGIATDTDLAKELLETYVDPDAPPRSQPTVVRSSALLGLGLAYAGTARADVAAMLTPYVADSRATWGAQAASELACVAGLGLGFVFVGTADSDIAAILAARVMDASSVERSQSLYRQLVLGLGLVFLGRGPAADATIAGLEDALDAIPAREARILVTACAYAGTGNVLKAQEMLRACGEHPEAEYRERRRKELEEEEEAAGTAGDKDKAGADAGGAAAASAAGAAAAAASASSSADKPAEGDDKDVGSGNPRDYQYQSLAALALGVISMGEHLGSSMVERAAGHLMLYGDPAVRRAVPLTIAMCRISDPAYATIDTLSKLSHDSDPLTAQSAILAMGLVGAGTNNSRLAGFLRQLATFHRGNQDHVFLVRIAQGLVAAGKGLVTLSPLHSDRVLVRPVAIAGILSVALTSLDLSGTLFGKHHTLLHCLAPAIMPRMVMTLDAKTREPVTVDVRIGAAVETVGQAGRPKTITGFQTHSSPALLNAKDRAEIAGEEWSPVGSVLEGVCLLEKRDVDKDAARDAAERRADKARAAAAEALARVPSKVAGLMRAASGYGDD